MCLEGVSPPHPKLLPAHVPEAGGGQGPPSISCPSLPASPHPSRLLEPTEEPLGNCSPPPPSPPRHTGEGPTYQQHPFPPASWVPAGTREGDRDPSGDGARGCWCGRGPGGSRGRGPGGRVAQATGTHGRGQPSGSAQRTQPTAAISCPRQTSPPPHSQGCPHSRLGQRPPGWRGAGETEAGAQRELSLPSRRSGSAHGSGRGNGPPEKQLLQQSPVLHRLCTSISVQDGAPWARDAGTAGRGRTPRCPLPLHAPSRVCTDPAPRQPHARHKSSWVTR